MTTAVDTSVILDVLTADPRFAAGSSRALREARAAGRLVVCETVIAEVAPAVETEQAMRDLMTSWGLIFEASNVEVALLAGEIFRLYLKRGGTKRRVVPDFLIGAHAIHYAQRLLARDRGYLRDYFSDLAIVDPGEAG